MVFGGWIYGYDASYGIMPDLTSIQDHSVQDMLQERHQHSVFLQNHLERARLRMKNMADRHRTDRSFQVGDKVLLKLQPYTQSSVVSRPCPKLSYKFYGPFEVEARVGSVAYRLKLPLSSMVHPVFHISQLKPFIPKYTAESNELPNPIVLDAAELVPEAILERRLIKKGTRPIFKSESSGLLFQLLLQHGRTTRCSSPVSLDAPAWRPAGSQGGRGGWDNVTSDEPPSDATSTV